MRPPFLHHHPGHAAVAGALIPLVTTGKNSWRRPAKVIDVDQMYLVQFLREAGVGVDAHTTGRNKHDPQFGVESLAVEFERGQWVVPDSPMTRTWMRELLAYSPAGHTGDRVMAAWLAREAARTAEAAPPFATPFLTSLAPMQFPAGTNVITARPGEFSEEMWQSVDGGMWPQW